jgi:Right handed beta helix region
MIAQMGTLRSAIKSRPKWYVDAVNGDDGHNGKSARNALRTIAAVLPKIRAGDMVLLASGSHWREEFSAPADRVEVAAYGTGARPLLDCSEPIAAGAWTKTAGCTNVYQATVPLELTTEWVSAWESDIRMIRATDTGNCDATATSYWCQDNVSPTTLYVHASDGSNPANNGKTYEYSKRAYGYDSGARTGCAVTGIQTRRNLAKNGSLQMGEDGTVNHCLASEGSKHNLFVYPGCRAVNCEAAGAYYTEDGGGKSWFVSAGFFTGKQLTFENCTGHNNGLFDPTAEGFLSHGSGDPMQKVTLLNCTVRDCYIAFDLTAAEVELTGCTVSNSENVGPGLTATTVLIQGCTFDVTNRSLEPAAGAYVTVRNSHLHTTTEVGVTIIRPNITLDIADSEVIHDTSFGIYVGGSSPFHLISRRVTYQVKDAFFVWYSPYTLDSDYNSFQAIGGWDPTTRICFSLNGQAYDLPDYKAATGQDVHSTL